MNIHMTAKEAAALGAVKMPRSRARKRSVRHSEGSEGERAFLHLTKIYIDEFSSGWIIRPEFSANPDRGWRIDFAWPDYNIGVEVDGYGHEKSRMYRLDREKGNWLAAHGWRILHVTPKELRDNPEPFFQLLRFALEEAENNHS